MKGHQKANKKNANIDLNIFISLWMILLGALLLGFLRLLGALLLGVKRLLGIFGLSALRPEQSLTQYFFRPFWAFFRYRHQAQFYYEIDTSQNQWLDLKSL